MFRLVSGHLLQAFRSGILNHPSRAQALVAINGGLLIRRGSHNECESDTDFDSRYEAYFNRPDIDHWEARKAMNDLFGMDLIPDPKIMVAALKACRRLNDYALAIRFLEAAKDRCGDQVKTIYPYLLQELRPTLCELGIETIEELGYDKPELAMKSFLDMEK